MLRYEPEKEQFDTEQLSIVVKEGLLFTFQEKPGDLFDPIRSRLQYPTTRIRSRGADYLCFALIDLILDYYLQSVEQFGERIETLESFNRLETKDIQGEITRLYQFRVELNYLRRTIKPVLELALQFRKSDSNLIAPTTRPYLKELEDNAQIAIDALESYHQLLSDQVAHLNSISANKLNEIMKVLTIFSVIFIPLTFVAGIYGTNFDYMPELRYRWAYPAFWLALVLIALGMVRYFRRKGWL